MSQSIGYGSNQILHSNYAYVVFNGNTIGRLEDVEFVIDKDASYDHIIGSGGAPFGQPIRKTIKFSGSFSKGMMITSALADNDLLLSAVGKDHANLGESHDPENFSTFNSTKFIDNTAGRLVLIPRDQVTPDGQDLDREPRIMLALSGLVITKLRIKSMNNSWIKMDGTFIGKYLDYIHTGGNRIQS